MATTTDRFSWPIPTGPDRLRDGDNAIAALGRAIDQAVVLGNEFVHLPTTTSTAAPSGSWQTLLFDTAAAVVSPRRDALATVDTAGPIVPINKPGLFLVSAVVQWAGAAASRRMIGVHSAQNAAPASINQSVVTVGTGVHAQSAAWLWQQGGPSGRICLNVNQDSGGSVSITAARLTIIRLGAA